MSSGIASGSSAASYDRFNSGVNTNISITDSSNTLIGDKSQVHGTGENQRVEKQTLQRDNDSDISTDGVDNSINTTPSPNEKALLNIVTKHGSTVV
ncbi:MAG: hypothetical protein LBS87_01435 [Puniceicoccales bacterium]|jgi:hypothetical protein|nr:hypothetical protein [Puniceicoccales bacterium]